MCDAKPTIEDLGAGETILGHPTHKYRVKSTSAAGGEDVTELSVATDMPGADGVFKRMGESFGGQAGGGASKCVGDVMASKMMKGFPLKVVSNAGGKTSTMEATRAEKISFDGSEFEIPAGFQTMDGSMFGGRGRGGI